jgi:hypothetical protein
MNLSLGDTTSGSPNLATPLLESDHLLTPGAGAEASFPHTPVAEEAPKESALSSVKAIFGGKTNKYIQKRSHIMRELIETERNYVTDLGLIVDGYMACMRDPDCEVPMPKDLKGGKDKIVFGNLEAIYEWHKK